MIITLLLAIMMMTGLFLLLWAGVGFIQNKKFFSSCPKEALELIHSKEERFHGQHVLGWILVVIAILLMGSSIVIGAVNGMRNGFAFDQFFIRFLIMLLLLKAFDIIFFDWMLLCNRGFGFFEHYYPEVADILSPKLFGYNKRDHIVQAIGIAVGSFIAAWICTLL